jgi:hypothetical protein
MRTHENLKRMSRACQCRRLGGLRHLRYLCLTCAVAAVALCVSAAVGQVRQIQGGNALDANPQVGGGGYNGARPVSSGINGNLIMSGNVTGGKAFRGFSPIGNPSSLQTIIPSASLSPFVRDSVGLPMIEGGQSVTAPRPYFDPSQTALTTGAVEAQALAPRDLSGTYRMGQGQYQVPVAPLGGTQPTVAGTGQLPYAAAGWTPAGIGMFNPDRVAAVPSQAVRGPLATAGLGGPLAVAQAGNPPVEPVTTTDQREGPGRPSGGESGQPGDINTQNASVLGGQPNLPPSDTSLIGTPPGGPPSAARAPDRSGQPGGLEAVDQNGSTLLTQMQQYSGTRRQATGLGAEPVQGLALVQKQQKPLDLSVSTAAQRPSDDFRLLRTGATAAQKQRMQADVSREQASRLVEERMRTPIRSLAGARQTQIDQMLAQAEDLMRKGEYYRAAGTYNGVITAAPENALAWLGRANALLAAGEYLQAYVALDRGIGRFPQVLAFDLDLPALVGNREVLDIRRAELEKLLSGNPDYRMQFLLGYMDYYSGQRSLGLQVIQKAAGAAPSGSVVRQAAEILQTQPPTTQPAT